jgi:nucleoid-associated protein YgaU
MTIAERFYGDRNEWYKIYEINKATLGRAPTLPDIPHVREGQVLHLPDLPSDGIRYTVEPGDLLERITTQYYGDHYDYLQDLIYEKNRTVIGYNRNSLNPGQELIIPLLEPLPDRTLLIRKGDTLWEIARAFYNDPSLGQSIYEYNRAVIGDDPDRLETGDKLILPPGSPPKSYTIKPNDTLQTISFHCYGTIGKFADIRLSNRDVIGYDIPGDDASFLHPGQELNLYGCTR